MPFTATTRHSRTRLAGVVIAIATSLLMAPWGPGPDAAKADIPAGGAGHECMVTNGHVKCWGANNLGQLGNGTLTSSAIATTVSGISNALVVSVATYHSCALLADHTVRCWGDNGVGQLGNGTTTNAKVPVAVKGISTAVAVSAGGSTSCALLADHTVRCWGWNLWGQLGNGKSTDAHTPATVSGITTATSLSSGDIHSCARLSSGSIKCWGGNGLGELGNGTKTDAHTPVAVHAITTALAVTAGSEYSCALLAGGSAMCWGANGSGQLGDGTKQLRLEPVAVTGLAAARSVTAGGFHSCALLVSGAINCWGEGIDGELGDGGSTASSVPVAVSGIGTAVRVKAHNRFTCGVLATGAATCWGRNDVGELGNGTKTPSSLPVAVTGVTVDVIAPTVTTPVVRPRSGAKLVGSAAPVVIGWSGADTGGSGLARYTLQVSTDAGAHWTTLSSSLTSASYTWTVPTTGSTAFRVRASDKLGNASAWAATHVLMPRLLQQTGTSITYAGTWRSQALTSFSGKSTRYATAAGARATLTTPATAKSIALVTTKGPNRGKVSVYVDGTRVAIVDCHAATTSYRVVAWQTTWSAPASHIVKLVVAGTAGRPRVDLDALVLTTEPLATTAFTVSVPPSTDDTGFAVTIPGTLSQLGGGLPDWDFASPMMTRVDATHWTITLVGPQGAVVAYKYALGDVAHVEKGVDCVEVPNRQVTLAYVPGGRTMLDTVENWSSVGACVP